MIEITDENIWNVFAFIASVFGMLLVAAYLLGRWSAYRLRKKLIRNGSYEI